MAGGISYISNSTCPQPPWVFYKKIGADNSKLRSQGIHGYPSSWWPLNQSSIPSTQSFTSDLGFAGSQLYYQHQKSSLNLSFEITHLEMGTSMARDTSISAEDSRPPRIVLELQMACYCIEPSTVGLLSIVHRDCSLGTITYEESSKLYLKCMGLLLGMHERSNEGSGTGGQLLKMIVSSEQCPQGCPICLPDPHNQFQAGGLGSTPGVPNSSRHLEPGGRGPTT